VTYLRNNPGFTGGFQLIRDRVPFIDPKWEKLQYACAKPTPLPKKKLQSINAVYESIKKEGIESLTPSILRAIIAERTDKETSREINQLFTLLGASWNIWLYPLVFGIEAVIVKFQIEVGRSLEEILDIHNPENSILGLSEIYKIRNQLNIFIGVFYTPDHLGDHLIQYLQQCERKGLLEIRNTSKIDDMRFSSSLKRYQPGEGWNQFTKTELNKLIQILRSDRSQEIPPDFDSVFITYPFNKSWNFRKHTNATRAADLYCRIPRRFTYENLPFSLNPQKNLLSKRDRAHLKELHNNRVAQVIFQVDRLVHAFSLDFYWIILPKIPLTKLAWLLRELPYTYLFYTDEEIHLWSVLPSDLVKKMQDELNYTIMPVIPTTRGCGCNIENFDQETLTWAIPVVLKDFLS
jgi:hypothetical protein